MSQITQARQRLEHWQVISAMPTSAPESASLVKLKCSVQSVSLARRVSRCLVSYRT